MDKPKTGTHHGVAYKIWQAEGAKATVRADCPIHGQIGKALIYDTVGDAERGIKVVIDNHLEEKKHS